MTKVAVIGVHGVGEHEAGATAEAIARLLEATAPGAYAKFTSQELKIPVDARGLGIAMPAVAAAVRPAQVRPAQPFAAFRAVMRPAMGPVAPDPDQQFTQSLLAGGADYKSVYETSFWSGHKIHDGERKRVDVYELYWSDLSHGAQSAAYAVFGQFIQLLVHLASLGKISANTAMPLAAAQERPWRWFNWLNANAYWLLSMPILIGNLWFLLLACLFVAGAGVLPDATLIAGVMGGAEAALLTGWILYRAEVGLGSPVLAVAAGGAVGYGVVLVAAHGAAWLLVFLAAGPVYGIGNYLMRCYEVMRPGAVWTWRFMGLALLGFAIIRWGGGQTAPGVIWAAGEFLFLALLIAWFFLCLNVFVITVLGLFLAVKLPDLSRVVHTCIAAALLPAPLFLGTSLFVWYEIYKIFQTFLNHVQIEPWIWLHGTWLRGQLLHLIFLKCPCGPLNCDTLLEAMIQASGGVLFLPYSAAALFGLLLIVFGLLPSIYAEIFPPGKSASAPALGNWLDAGFHTINFVAFMVLAVFWLISLGGIFDFPMLTAFWQKSAPYVQYLEEASVGATGASLSFLGLTKLLSGTLSNAFNRLRVPVDTLLDVDNWLRERPVGNTMRLHVFARYRSLLRHLRAAGYDEVEIVAHSQGAVMTADLLRHVTRVAPLDFGRVRFLSMGCPLRQLYEWRFPQLYGWAAAPPVLGQFGLESWVNAYGSGDYVGRDLWNPLGKFVPAALPVAFALPGTAELCIGAQAHTHYLDPGSAVIGQSIDLLIG